MTAAWTQRTKYSSYSPHGEIPWDWPLGARHAAGITALTPTCAQYMQIIMLLLLMLSCSYKLYVSHDVSMTLLSYSIDSNTAADITNYVMYLKIV